MSGRPNDPNQYFSATGMPDPDWWTVLWPDPMAVLRKLGYINGMTAVDLCCGDGLFTAPLSQLLGGQVIAVDLDPVMLKLAEHNVQVAGAPPCQWVIGDARDLPQLISQAVDSVLIANTFHGVPDQATLTTNITAVLKSGGTLIIINWCPIPREETIILDRPRGPRTEMRMSPDGLKKTVEPSGLSLEQIVELPPYHYGAVFKKP